MTPRIICAALAAILIAVALLALRPPERAGGSLRDFQVYRAAGAVAADRGDPYSAAVARYEPALPHGAMMQFVSTPATLPFWRFFARLSDPAATALWKLLLGCALLALSLGTAMLARVRSPFELLCIALATLAFAPNTTALALGQTAIVGAAAAALALALRTSAALATGSFIALAFQPNTALGLLAALRRGGVWIGLAIVALYACGGIESGPLWPIAYAHLLVDQSAAEGRSVMQLTPGAIAYGFGATPASAGTVAILAALAALVAAAIAAWRSRNERLAFAAISCALPFVCSYFHAQNFTALFAPAMIALRSAPARVQGLALCATIAIGGNWLDFAASPHALAQDLVLGCGLIAACLALFSGISAKLVLYALGNVAFLAIGAWLGAMHPIPLWPDGFPGIVFPAHAGATHLWHDELAATGLLMPNPASALLRMLPLAGSATLLILLCKMESSDLVRIEEAKLTTSPD